MVSSSESKRFRHVLGRLIDAEHEAKLKILEEYDREVEFASTNASSPSSPLQTQSSQTNPLQQSLPQDFRPTPFPVQQHGVQAGGTDFRELAAQSYTDY